MLAAVKGRDITGESVRVDDADASVVMDDTKAAEDSSQTDDEGQGQRVNSQPEPHSTPTHTVPIKP